MAQVVSLESCIRGYHIYKTWDPEIGEVLQCAREPTNVIDRYAVLCDKKIEMLLAIYPKGFRKCVLPLFVEEVV